MPSPPACHSGDPGASFLSQRTIFRDPEVPIQKYPQSLWVGAAKTLPSVLSLQARLLEVDEPTAKAIILGLNGIGGRMKELEEAWIVQSLVREDGLSQLQVLFPVWGLSRLRYFGVPKCANLDSAQWQPA